MTATRQVLPGAPAGSWGELLARAASVLGDAREARWMVEEAAGEPWLAALACGRAPGEKPRARLEAMVARRRLGEPLQYVLGSWQFRTLDLMVDRRVLIPRPETETVVEAALAELDRLAGCASGEGGPSAAMTAVDLGTGSGAIALSVAAERKGVEVWASDVDPAALEVARANLAGMGGRAASRVRVVLSDWWRAMPGELRGTVDLVVSNPPYISAAEMERLDPVVRDWEPHTALDGGPGGLDAVEAVLSGAPSFVRPGGTAVLEVAPERSGRARAIALRAGFAESEVLADLAGRPRVLVARGAP